MDTDSYEYQYPPELLQMLIEVIPRLHRSKDDLLEFFTTTGVAETDLRDLRQRVRTSRDQISMFEITRTVLHRLSDKKGAGLGVRRAVLQRVTSWENFATGWPNNLTEAERLVGKIQKFVRSKDSLTRAIQSNDEERRHRAEAERKRLAEIQEHKEASVAIRTNLASLFGNTNPQKRGKLLEEVLNRYFKFSEIHVRDAFTLTGSDGEGILEQIDGVVELDGQVYLVEMKWWNEPVGVEAVTQHISRLYARAQANGIFISATGFTKTAVTTCQNALSQKVIVLCELQEIVSLLEQEKSLKKFLKEKVDAARIEKRPLVYPLRSTGF